MAAPEEEEEENEATGRPTGQGRNAADGFYDAIKRVRR